MSLPLVVVALGALLALVAVIAGPEIDTWCQRRGLTSLVRYVAIGFQVVMILVLLMGCTS